MKKTLLLAMLLSGLSGCSMFATKPTEPVVIKTEYVSVNVPVGLFKKCVPSNTPVTKEAYLDLTPIEREQYLTDYVITLMGDLKVCNSKLTGIEKIVNSTKSNLVEK